MIVRKNMAWGLNSLIMNMKFKGAGISAGPFAVNFIL
jgi:hypothetical protein